MNKKVVDVALATIAVAGVGALAYKCKKLSKELDKVSGIVNDAFDVLHTCATFHAGCAVSDLSNNSNVEKANLVAHLFNTIEQRNRYVMDELSPRFGSWSGMRMCLITPDEDKSCCGCNGCGSCSHEESTYFDEDLDTDEEEDDGNEGK